MTPPLKRRLPRKLIGTVILLSVFIGPSSFRLLLDKWLISRAVSGATSIRIEEYRTWIDQHELDARPGLPDQILVVKHLRPADYSKVNGAFPLFLDAGVPLLEKMCLFNPHHRIVITGKAGDVTVVRVNFQCDQIQVESDGDNHELTAGVSGTPFLWQIALRRYFAGLGMPERPSGAYIRHPTRNGPEAKRRVLPSGG